MNTSKFDRRGSALMMVLVLGIAALILVLAVIGFSYGSFTFSAGRTNYINSLMVSESALNYAVKTKHKSPEDFVASGTVPESPPYKGQELVDYLWNDAPGIKQDNMKLMLQDGDYLIGAGEDGQYVRAVRVKYRQANPPELPSAMYIHSPDCNPSMLGAALNINGNDHTAGSYVPDGTGEDKHGIANSTEDGLQSWLDLFDLPQNKHKKDNIQGVGTSPDIVNSGEIPDIDTMIEMYLSMATIISEGNPIITGASELVPGADVVGTPDDPEVVVIKNDVKIAGNLAGCGVFVVEGDLFCSGSFEWWGIVIVKGDFEVGAGSADIWGAMLIEDSDAVVDVDIKGSLDIMYSTEAISFVSAMVFLYHNTWEEL
ncbi:hypothetical protein J7K50_00105 [bacterium]|nr:hypothetical protein [bacterium]